MKLSIVTTLYQSSLFIDEFYERMVRVVRGETEDYEIIFVNDGSPDDSLEKAVSLWGREKRVKVVDLSRNYGHHRAIMTGLEYASGDYVYLLDSDLEEEPEWLSSFLDIARRRDYDLVTGRQSERHGKAFKRFGGTLFYHMFNLFSPVSVPENTTIARVMSRRYVKALLGHGERELFFAGLCALTGFRQGTVAVSKRDKGSTSYSPVKRLSQAVDAITSFSSVPLYFIFVLGCAVFFFSCCYIGWILVQKMFFSIRVGFTSMIASIWAVGGLIMICTGVIGVYLGKIFSEVKRRPVIVKQVYEFDDV